MEGNEHGLFQSTTPSFPCRDNEEILSLV